MSIRSGIPTWEQTIAEVDCDECGSEKGTQCVQSRDTKRPAGSRVPNHRVRVQAARRAMQEKRGVVHA